MGKMLAADAAWKAAEAWLRTSAASACPRDGIESKSREARLDDRAHLHNMVLVYIAEHVLGMPLYRRRCADLKIAGSSRHGGSDS